MHLLRYSDTGDLSLIPFRDEPIPTYASLSHTWGADTEEVTFEDLMTGTGKDKSGYEEIRFRGEQASSAAPPLDQTGDGSKIAPKETAGLRDMLHLGIESVQSLIKFQKEKVLSGYTDDKTYLMEGLLRTAAALPNGPKTREAVTGQFLTQLWVDLQQPPQSYTAALPNGQKIDTCCIDKETQAGSSLAVTSMAHWYRNAKHCYVYPLGLSTTEQTVSGQSTWESDFQGSKWFAKKLVPAPYSVEYKRSRESFGLELEVLRKMSHRHVVRLLGSYIHKESVGLSSHQVVVCDLGTFFENAEALISQKVQKVEHLKAEFKPKYMLEYQLHMFGGNATKCDEIGANCGLSCQHIRIQGLCNIQHDRADSSEIYQHPSYSAPRYACQAPQLPLPHPFHIAPTWGCIGHMLFVPGAEEQCVADSNVTCSTALSDKTSVFSKPSENDPVAGTEISNHYNPSPSMSQSWQEVPLLRMDQILPANAYESCKPELQNNGPVTPGFEHPRLSADGREDSGYGDQELPTLGKDTAHSEEAILANYETSALRDFVDDPGHQYWTWCKEHQNWWHKDEKTNAMIWAPLDFD
ncbi:hypothetical protein AA0111_g9998 [Alternaria arborescens]|uniref:hypothetical protein n=1 Tax=Alternaria arborescens TaxID=156630 RepID=UPI001074E8B5|nr:hypothetical protein AA0111_g9998 [Alternaria arborescens]RYO20556.1 hypothetical protein AA0111_g9998 [Alternaria arborescens]